MVPAYEEVHGSGPDSTYYVACTDGIPTLLAKSASGEALPQMTGEQVTVPNARAASVAASGCVIPMQYQVSCEWAPYYSRINGETGVPVWTRTITADATVNLQGLTHQVQFRFLHDQYVPFTVDAGVSMLRMRGLGSPLLVASAQFPNGPLSSMQNETFWITRDGPFDAKYALSFHLNSIYDSEEGVDIPILGSPQTTPRFQCRPIYEGFETPGNCYYPNGLEAPVLP